MNNEFISMKSIMRFSFSKKFRPFHIVSILFFVLLNVWGLGGLFRDNDGNMLDPVGLSYDFTLLFVIVWGFVSICTMTPYALHKSTIEDERILQIGTVNRTLSIGVTISFYVVVQILVLVVCNILSPVFNTPIIELLHTGLSIYVASFIFLVICALICVFSRSVRWYFIGFLTLNFASIIIGWGCYEVYDSNPLVVNVSYNPFKFNLFTFSISVLINNPVVLFLTVAVIVIFLAVLKYIVKKPLHINIDKATTVYKLVTVFLISLSCGFVISYKAFSEIKVTLTFVLCFVIVSLLVAAAFTYFSFRGNKPILHTSINLLAVIVSATLILTLIPNTTQKAAYTLPDAEDISSVEIFLDSMESFEIDKHFDECTTLHSDLLEVLKKQLPDEVSEPYTERDCLADVWNQVNFTYKLKNGESLHREYKYLNDPAFDEFYIKLLQSDLYLYSLQNTQMKKPSMRYHSSTQGYCELPASCVNELLAAYCEELQKADKSAFYEDYETIRFYDNDLYEYGSRIIYIPYSFEKTRNLAKTYIDLYS